MKKIGGRREFFGIGASCGEAQGRIFCKALEVSRQAAEQSIHTDPAAESLKLKAACSAAVRELDDIIADLDTRAGGAAEIFRIHRMLAGDDDLLEAAEQKIAAGETAAEAIVSAGREAAAAMAEISDEYLGERAADIADVAERIARHLSGGKSAAASIPDGSVILARDLSPGDTAALDTSRVRGFITLGGSPASHTAILARQLGIPAVVRLRGIEERELCDLNGREVLMDGAGGRVVIEPTLPELEAQALRAAGERERRSNLAAAAALPAVTRSGRRVTVAANIGTPDEAEGAASLGAEGVGLFRSEFLYLGRPSPPDEEEQLAAYRRVLAAVPRGHVVIRTLDIGADKQDGRAVSGNSHEIEENPALGVRGIRRCLLPEHLGEFRTQLRALCRASVGGRLEVMLPMVTTPGEVERVRELLRDVQNELRFEEAAFDPEMPLGIMIETPAAALMAEELCRTADFFSVGTNDLCQYTLAADRQSAELGEVRREGTPAVLRLIGLVCDAVRRARKSGAGRVRRVGVCGDMAADPALCAELVGLGVDELSLPPPAIPEIKAIIRELE